MFIKKFAEDSFIDSIEINLKNLESQDQLSEAQCLDSAVNFIRLSADLLDEIGMESQAEELTQMLDSLADSNHEGHEHEEEHEEDEDEIVVSEEDEEDEEEEGKDHHKADDNFAKDSLKKKKKNKSDPATKGLNSKKMVKNLKQKGWVFNAKDGCCPECGGDIDDTDDSFAKDKKLCDLCGETCSVSMVEDSVICKNCVKEAQDCGMIYDCMYSWDANDAEDKNNAPKCTGWKKAPVGSPKQRAFCKRHCGMKKKLTSKKVADDPDSCINQGLRRWKCRCS